MTELEAIPFDQLLKALVNYEKPFPPKFIYRLSDLTAEETTSLAEIWPEVQLERRLGVMEDVQSMGEDDYLLDFSGVGKLALKDVDANIRELAVRTLADYEQDDLLPIFLYMVEHDSSEAVRAASAAALGVFVYKGEIEEISQKKLNKIEEILLRVHQSSDTPLVRRKALESMGYSSRDEMPALIERAYSQGEREWLVSALLAMGRSSNSQWNPDVIACLEDRRHDVRAEAVTAAGELGIRAATRRVIALLDDAHDDVRGAAIWALSEIGGEGVRGVLEALLEDTDDEDEADLIESALENLSFTEDFDKFAILELDESESDEEEEDFEESDYYEADEYVDDEFEDDEEDDDDEDLR